jgi:predicted DNA-binding protein
MAGKKIQITLPPEVFEKLERMSKKTSQKKSVVIISAINTIYALQQQQTTVQIDGQGVMI